MGEAQQGRGREARLLRFLPLLVLAAAIAAFFASGLGRYLSFAALAEHREWLLGWVARAGLLAPLAYIALYIAVAALSVPGGLFLTLAGGFLFGTWEGGLCALLGATIGAAIIFLIARSSLGEVLRRRAGPFLRRIEAGSRRTARAIFWSCAWCRCFRSGWSIWCPRSSACRCAPSCCAASSAWRPASSSMPASAPAPAR